MIDWISLNIKKITQININGVLGQVTNSSGKKHVNINLDKKKFKVQIYNYINDPSKFYIYKLI